MNTTAKKQETIDFPDPIVTAAPVAIDQTMSPTIGKLALALSRAQGAIHGAKKDSQNPFFKSTYADLAAVLDAAREPLAKNGLAVIQTTAETLSGVTVITLLAHESGEWIRGTLHMNPVKNDPQGIGSCMTYARRYSYAAIVGIAQVDDDANAASQKPAAAQKQRISDEQALELNALITDNDLDMGAIHAWLRSSYKCNSIEQLTTEVYPIVKGQIQKKISAK